VGLTALLLAELVALQIRFDTESLEDVSAWWADLVGQVHLIPPLGLTVGAALLLFVSDFRREEPGPTTAPSSRPHRWGLFLLGHLLALAAFAWLSRWVIEGDLESTSRWPGAWVAAWAAAGLTTLVLWGAALLPPGLWLPLVQRRWKALLACVAIGVAAWGAGWITRGWWEPLSRATLWSVHQLLALVCEETIYWPDELLVGTTGFQVFIEEPCSGCEGIGLVWVFLGAYLWFFRYQLTFPRALLLLVFGTVAIWLANVLRITALVSVGTWLSPEIAAGGFHSAAGWLAFNAVALGLITAAHHTRFFGSTEPLPFLDKSPAPTTAYLAPLFTIMAMGMLTRALTDGTDALYPLRVLAAGGVLWYFRNTYASLRGPWSWADVGASVGIGVLAFAVWVALEPQPQSGPAQEAPWDDLPRWWVVPWLVFRVLGSVVTVPLAEELAFRGYLPRRLQARDFQAVPISRFRWIPFLASSVLFGLLHGSYLAGVAVGMLFALALYRRGRLGDAVLAHATTNALVAVSVLLFGAWSLWP
jgi:exosortase E/protease (VPEID-CTERM system)